MKKRYRNTAFYVGVTGGFAFLVYCLIIAGSKLEDGGSVVSVASGNTPWADFVHSIASNLGHPLALLLAQIVTIILTARLLGWLCNRIGQPAVIGEIIAGIVLGPSLIGYYFPAFSEALFPVESLGNLQFISQIGLILFMFIIGMELDLKILKKKAGDAVIVSHASIVIPFALGMALSYFLYANFAPEGVRFSSFGLFLGISMSVTAFPVLARIMQERGLHRSRIGTIAITCAAADDITAWSLLAVIIAIVKAGSFVSALYTIGLALLYVAAMIWIVKPFLARVGKLHSERDHLSKSIVAIFFLVLIMSSWATEVIGIHALFGAFLTGVIMPDNAKFRSSFIEKVEDVALVLLLPLYFVYTGLRTEIGLLDDPYLWKMTGYIILVAIAGKFVGSAIAAKYVGQNWKDSLTIGALMNTRGLMELVILNIGYDLGVLTPEIFAMMVIMALFTTFMTGPAIAVINRIFRDLVAVEGERKAAEGFKVLVSFANPARVKSLLRIARGFAGGEGAGCPVTVLHLSQGKEVNQYKLEKYEKTVFSTVNDEARRLDLPVHTLFRISNDIEKDVSEEANRGGFDLLLIGIGQSIYEGTVLGRFLRIATNILRPGMVLRGMTSAARYLTDASFDQRTREIILLSKAPVGVLLDRELKSANKVLIPIYSKDDSFLTGYGEKLLQNAGSKLTLLDMTGAIRDNDELREYLHTLGRRHPGHVNIIPEYILDNDIYGRHDLMMLSVDGWKHFTEAATPGLQFLPSVLILSYKG